MHVNEILVAICINDLSLQKKKSMNTTFCNPGLVYMNNVLTFLHPVTWLVTVVDILSSGIWDMDCGYLFGLWCFWCTEGSNQSQTACS